VLPGVDRKSPNLVRVAIEITGLQRGSRCGSSKGTSGITETLQHTAVKRSHHTQIQAYCTSYQRLYDQNIRPQKRRILSPAVGHLHCSVINARAPYACAPNLLICACHYYMAFVKNNLAHRGVDDSTPSDEGRWRCHDCIASKE
jgi:hypothetical protein